MDTQILVEGPEKGPDKGFLTKLIAQKSLLTGNVFEIDTQEKFHPEDKNCSIEEVLKYLSNIHKNRHITNKEIRIKNLLIIVDADQNVGERFKKIVSILKKNSIYFSIPSRAGEVKKEEGKINVGVFLFPNNHNKGSLESLIWNCLDGGLAIKKSCIENYINCLKKNSIDDGMTVNNVEKAKVRIMAATPKPHRAVDSLINLIDFQSETLEGLTRFLREVS